MNLYEISEEMLNCVDAETGEVDTDKLDELAMLRDEKLESIALWIKDLKAEAEALKAEKLVFAARQSAAERRAESLKNYLTGFLHGEKFKRISLCAFNEKPSPERVTVKCLYV